MQEESLAPDVFPSVLLLVDRVAASVPGSRFGRENKSAACRFIRRKSVDPANRDAIVSLVGGGKGRTVTGTIAGSVRGPKPRWCSAAITRL